jgi:hypothetical protein
MPFLWRWNVLVFNIAKSSLAVIPTFFMFTTLLQIRTLFYKRIKVRSRQNELDPQKISPPRNLAKCQEKKSTRISILLILVEKLFMLLGILEKIQLHWQQPITCFCSKVRVTIYLFMKIILVLLFEALVIMILNIFCFISSLLLHWYSGFNHITGFKTFEAILYQVSFRFQLS